MLIYLWNVPQYQFYKLLNSLYQFCKLLKSASDYKNKTKKSILIYVDLSTKVTIASLNSALLNSQIVESIFTSEKDS